MMAREKYGGGSLQLDDGGDAGRAVHNDGGIVRIGDDRCSSRLDETEIEMIFDSLRTDQAGPASKASPRGLKVIVWALNRVPPTSKSTPFALVETLAGVMLGNRSRVAVFRPDQLVSTTSRTSRTFDNWPKLMAAVFVPVPSSEYTAASRTALFPASVVGTMPTHT